MGLFAALEGFFGLPLDLVHHRGRQFDPFAPLDRGKPLRDRCPEGQQLAIVVLEQTHGAAIAASTVA